MTTPEKCKCPKCGSRDIDEFRGTIIVICRQCDWRWIPRDQSEIDRLEARIAELEGKAARAEECLTEIRDENKVADSVWLESDTNDTYGRWLARQYLTIPRPTEEK